MRRTTASVPVAALVLMVGVMMAGTAAGQTVPVGSPSVVEGTVSMLVEDDFLHGHVNTYYFLDEPARHGRYDLKLTPRQVKRVQPGMRVRVMGSLAGHVLTADADQHGVAVLEAPVAAAPVAALRVLVLLVDITDSNLVTHAISSTCDDSSAMAAAKTFGFNTAAASVDGCYQSSSFGQLGVGGASYPGTNVDVQRVTISDSVKSCNYTAWGSKADAVATDLASYEHRVYVVPADTNCGWAGLAYVNACPGPYCQSWVRAYGGQACGYVDAIAHEMGHNIGLMHASWDTNNDGSIDCEYCDDSDFMGYAEAILRPLNGPHRVQMGWVAGPGIADASGGGQFTLSPLNEAGAPLPQVAKIIPSIGDPYYVSYRVAAGYDAALLSTSYSAGVVGEISIHRWPGGITNTRFLTSLGDGQTFTDAQNGFSIVQNSHSSSSVTFMVSVGLPAPTNLHATAGDARVTLSWTASAGATGYNIKRTPTSGGPYATVASSVSGTSYVDTPLVNGQTYYYVVSAVSGSGESADSAQVSATPNGVDLVETAVSNPPAQAAPGTSFTATDTVKNQGAVTAAASTTRYYLSTDRLKDGNDVLLGGSRSVSSLAAGLSGSGNATVTIPATMPLGSYYVLACADDLNVVIETIETNNCFASATAVQVTRPDLVDTAVSNPPTVAAPGGTFSVTDTVKNQGAVTAAASTTRYYLSVDRQSDGGDVLLGGSRSVSSLVAGLTGSGSATVTIPATIPLGSYYVLACADDLNVVVETIKTNNCFASATAVQVTGPDLVDTAVSNPPTVAAPGGTFSVTDSVKNQGAVTAGVSTTRYYLSRDRQKDGSDVLLGGSRAVSSLATGKTSSGNTTVTIPSTLPLGTYYVLACADDTNAVIESDESNNCLASTTAVQVTSPDLVTTVVGNPPTTAARGGTFKATDTVKNQGLVTAGASTTRYYLSRDRQRDGNDVLLGGSRSVSSLATGKTSSGNAMVTISTATPPGTYYLLACTDDLGTVGELDETNNCLASTTTVVVP